MASVEQTQLGHSDQAQHVSGKVFQSAELTHSSPVLALAKTPVIGTNLICVTQFKTLFPYQNLPTNGLSELKLFRITFRSTYYPSNHFSYLPQSPSNLNSMLSSGLIHLLLNFNTASKYTRNHFYTFCIFCLPFIVHAGIARFFFFFLSWCVFAITKHYSQGRLFKCAGVLFLYLPLPFIKLFYIKNSQAWSFQRETYTTVPSINKEYNTNGNWKYSPSPLQGFCSWDIARKTVSHLFLPPGLNLLAVRLLHYSCQHFWSYRLWMKQFSSVQITLTPQNKWHAFQIFSHPQKKSIKNWKCLFLVKQWWHPASLTDDSILHITAYD